MRLTGVQSQVLEAMAQREVWPSKLAALRAAGKTRAAYQDFDALVRLGFVENPEPLMVGQGLALDRSREWRVSDLGRFVLERPEDAALGLD